MRRFSGISISTVIQPDNAHKSYVNWRSEACTLGPSLARQASILTKVQPQNLRYRLQCTVFWFHLCRQAGSESHERPAATARRSDYRAS